MVREGEREREREGGRERERGREGGRGKRGRGRGKKRERGTDRDSKKIEYVVPDVQALLVRLNLDAPAIVHQFFGAGIKCSFRRKGFVRFIRFVRDGRMSIFVKTAVSLRKKGCQSLAVSYSNFTETVEMAAPQQMRPLRPGKSWFVFQSDKLPSIR